MDTSSDTRERLVLLIDDHPLFRVGMRSTMQGVGVAARVLEASTVIGALDALAAHPVVDLILYDWHLQGGGGVKGLLAVSQCAPGVPVLVVSASEDEAVKVAALALGAVEYVSKADDSRRMLEVLRRWLGRGAPPVPAPAGGRLPPRPPAPAALTLRQQEVLNLMARGNANKTIADQLHIAETTVRAHVSDILRLLHVRNRTEAVVVATRAGMV